MKKGILSALVLTMALAPTAVGVNAHYDSTLKKPGIKTVLNETKNDEVKYNVLVKFRADDISKGYFTESSDVSELTFQDFAPNNYSLPKVTAKEGYVFTGWSVSGKEDLTWPSNKEEFNMGDICHIYQNEGNATIYPNFEEVRKEVLVHFNIDLEKGYFTDNPGIDHLEFGDFADSAAQYDVPKVTAKDGYIFKGWKGYGATDIEWDANTLTFGLTGLCHFNEGENIGYATIEPVFEKVEAPRKEVLVHFNIDLEKGYFTENPGTDHLQFGDFADSAAQYDVPKVTAKDGYIFKGWKGYGATDIEWDASSTTFGITGLCHFNENENIGYATIEAVFEKVTPEKPVEPKPEVKPEAKPENKPVNKPASTWDDGGPFTTNAEGDVFDRWGNLIYDAPAKAHSSNGYTMVNTSDR